VIYTTHHSIIIGSALIGGRAHSEPPRDHRNVLACADDAHSLADVSGTTSCCRCGWRRGSGWTAARSGTCSSSSSSAGEERPASHPEGIVIGRGGATHSSVSSRRPLVRPRCTHALPLPPRPVRGHQASHPEGIGIGRGEARPPVKRGYSCQCLILKEFGQIAVCATRSGCAAPLQGWTCQA
jgi:hypothetical protein